MKVRLANRKKRTVEVDEDTLTLVATLECDRCGTTSNIYCDGKRMFLQDVPGKEGKTDE